MKKWFLTTLCVLGASVIHCDEVEDIFPEAQSTLINFKGCEATHHVVSDDGRFIAFQPGMSGDEAGVGHGLFQMEVAP